MRLACNNDWAAPSQQGLLQAHVAKGAACPQQGLLQASGSDLGTLVPVAFVTSVCQDDNQQVYVLQLGPIV